VLFKDKDAGQFPLGNPWGQGFSRSGSFYLFNSRGHSFYCPYQGM